MGQKAAQPVQYYLDHISAYEREFKRWESRADKILKRYRDDSTQRSTEGKFNVLWSNVQTLKSATFARTPQPDVSRRFKDSDPVGRVASLILERALAFEVDHYKSFGASIRQAVYDRFLGGRGTCWVRYEPTFKQVQAGALEDGDEVTEDVDAESQAAEELDFECAAVDYVHWRDFGHSVARTWEEVSIVWRRVYMTRTALDERFGEEAKGIPLDAVPDDQVKLRGSSETDNIQKRALIYEAWDKETGQAVWISKSLGEIIDAKTDPLGLEEFFPCPPPLYATLTTDSLVPLPDYTMYQDQAAELDMLSGRIAGLIKALQVKGVYDASIPELARLFTEANNTDLIPVKNWAAFSEKQGLKGAIDLVEILPIAQALREAYAAFEQVKGQIYELTGISDIIRGQTNANETATAQQIKNSYASMRLKTYQDEVERFAARLLQLKAQIICNHFDAETIAQISSVEQLSPADQQYIGPALGMLKQGAIRSFRIEISTDSMVFQDEQQTKQDRTEFLQAVTGFLQNAMQAGPQMAPLAMELLKFTVSGYRAGKTLEGVIDQTADQLRQQAAQAAQSPQPNPEAMKVQADMQKAQMMAQADAQSDQARAQADMAIAHAKASAEAQVEAQRMAHEQQLAAFQERAEQARQAQQQQHEQTLAAFQQQADANLQVILAHIKAASAVEVAEVAAQTTIDAAQISAAKQGAE